MIDLKYTIDNKQPFLKKDGNTVIDLTAPSLEKNVSFSVLDYFIVRNNEQMRPDVLAQRYYGNIVNTEMLMKFNGISNPFSIEEGEIMIIADPVTGRSAMINNAVVNRGDIRKQYFQPEKEGKPDPRLKVFEKRQTVKPNKRKNGQALPPNYANPGDKEIEIRGGKIVFGANVSQGGTGTADVPLEKQKFLNDLTKRSEVQKVQKESQNIVNTFMSADGTGGNGTGGNGTGGNGTGGNGTGTGSGSGADSYSNLPQQNFLGLPDNGVPNSKMTPAQVAKVNEQKQKRESEMKSAMAKVNLSKSEIIAKMIKQLYKL